MQLQLPTRTHLPIYHATDGNKIDDVDHDLVTSTRAILSAQQLSQQEKLATRPVSELDVTSWKRCTTSYVQLPTNYPELPCSGRRNNALLVGLLNDEWVSVTSGSEDYSFKV